MRRVMLLLVGGLTAAMTLADAAKAPIRADGLSRAAVYKHVEQLRAIGRKLFFDPALSVSGKLACASCHDPAHGYGPANDLPVQPGGSDMRQFGTRAVPSLTYLQADPQFTEHYYESDDEADSSVDNGPTGGLTWDGRIDRARDQARLPLLSPYEMANPEMAAVVAAVRRSAYADDLRRAFGERLFEDPARASEAVLESLEAYEQTSAEFFPYTSKYDAYLAGKVALTPQEVRGLVAFNDPKKGNCAHCHMSEPAFDGTPPQFTDYGLAAVGVPRNSAILANADPEFFDLGLCGPLRTDLRDHPEYCGMFRAPSLRNVALRKSFFHNGVFHTLREAVAFYAERDTNPEKWYPRDADGTVRKFDDLPREYWPNVNVEPPFDRHLGDKPALTDQEIDDIVAFLQTLTDGYRAGATQALSR
jgi:cytochrome c peroxidase